MTLYQNPVNTPNMSNLERAVYIAAASCENVLYNVTPQYLDTGSLPVTSVAILAAGDRGLVIDEVLVNER